MLDLSTTRTIQFRRQISTLVSLSQVVLLGLLVYQNRELLPLVTRLAAPSIISSCFLLYLISSLLQFSVWSELMGYRRTEQSRALEEYIRSNFMGRLPGGLWKIAGRMTVYRAPRLSRRAILIINVVEILLMLLASGVLILLLSRLHWYMQFTGFAGLAFGLVLLATFVIHTQPALQSTRKPLRWITWIGKYIIAWLCGGIITYLVVAPFDATTTFANAFRYWCIAGAIGLLFQAVPLNMLIRDATLVMLLQPFMPLTNAIAATFAVRLVMLVCDLATGWTLLGLVGLRRRAFFVKHAQE